MAFSINEYSFIGALVTNSVPTNQIQRNQTSVHINCEREALRYSLGMENELLKSSALVHFVSNLPSIDAYNARVMNQVLSMSNNNTKQKIDFVTTLLTCVTEYKSNFSFFLIVFRDIWS